MGLSKNKYSAGNQPTTSNFVGSKRSTNVSVNKTSGAFHANGVCKTNGQNSKNTDKKNTINEKHQAKGIYEVVYGSADTHKTNVKNQKRGNSGSFDKNGDGIRKDLPKK